MSATITNKAPYTIEGMYHVLPVAESAGYRGCGKAWAAIDQDGVVVGLRYMGDYPLPKTLKTKQQGPREMTFSEYRDACRGVLAAQGTVVSGECSCCEFVTARAISCK
jgi:hypothetical protein